MDIQWSYILIGVLYFVVLATNAIDEKLAPKEIGEEDQAFYIFKLSFFTTVMISCIVVTVLINPLALMGGRPINMHSILITLLIVGVTLLESISKVYIKDQEELYLCGATLEKDEIESIEFLSDRKIKIAFKESLEGYESNELFLLTKEEAVINSIKKFFEESPNK